MTAKKLWTVAYSLTKTWLISAATAGARATSVAASGRSLMENTAALSEALRPEGEGIGSGGVSDAGRAAGVMSSAGGVSSISISGAPSTLQLLEHLQREGATDELLMALIAVREASGAWLQAAAMFRWMQTTQATDFTLSKEAHTIIFEMLFTQVLESPNLHLILDWEGNLCLALAI